MTLPRWLESTLRAPFEAPFSGRLPGLAPMAPGDWVVHRPDYAAQMARRVALVAERGDTVVSVPPDPVAGAAAEAFQAALIDELSRHHAQRFAISDRHIRCPDGRRVPRDDPRAVLALTTAEDWLLIDVAGPVPRLVAGAVCFPAHWALDEKLGRPLQDIHGPVPEYGAELGRRVDRIFMNLKPQAAVERYNWGLVPGAEMHTPPDRPQPMSPEGVHLRVERQTLRRLEGAPVVAFSVLTSVAPLRALDPGLRSRILTAVRAQDETTRAYKYQPLVREALAAAGA